MPRIIPWDLPPISGGSEGGYTPQPTPEPPAEEIYLRFAAAPSITNAAGTNKSVWSSQTIAAGFTGMKNIISALSLKIDPSLEVVNLVGVSSLVLKVEGRGYNTDGSNYYEGDVSIFFDVDPMTLIATFNSGQFDIKTNTYTTSNDTVNLYNSDDTSSPYYDKMTLYVYNGNGEIIQTAEYPEEE